MLIIIVTHHCNEKKLRVQLLLEAIKQHKRIQPNAVKHTIGKILQISTIHEVHSMSIDFLHALPKFSGWT